MRWNSTPHHIAQHGTRCGMRGDKTPPHRYIISYMPRQEETRYYTTLHHTALHQIWYEMRRNEMREKQRDGDVISCHAILCWCLVLLCVCVCVCVVWSRLIPRCDSVSSGFILVHNSMRQDDVTHPTTTPHRSEMRPHGPSPRRPELRPHGSITTLI